MKTSNVLDTPLADGSAAVITWPGHLGVEGLSARAARAMEGHATAAEALAALRAWLPGLGNGAGEADLVRAVRADGFPYAEVLAHYQVVGRPDADGELTRRLRTLDGLLRHPALAGDGRLWPLREWLPSTIDHDTGNYDSYLVSPLLESLTDVGGAPAEGFEGRGGAEDHAIDALLAGLAADLARTEAEALRLGPPSPLQMQRTRASLVVLSRVSELSPRWARGAGIGATPVAGLVDDRADAWRLAEVTGRLAEDVWARVPAPCRQAVELATLPATPLHDEVMFIRSIQLFETMYRQIYRCLVRANDAMQALDVHRAHAELADATDRLEMSPVLYRVVTTMPRSAFAIIREYTHGRSAVQSRAYRQIQMVCAPHPPSPVADKIAAVQVPTPTLQESFVALADRLDPPDVAHLGTQMRALDTNWRAMKRTHWGITLKIIGKVPGTGGTSGADYLKYAAEIPLFPELIAH